MRNGIENGYYHEITPAGFGLAIKAGKVLFSKQSDFQKVEIFETESTLGRVLTLDDLMMTTEGDEFHYHEMIVHIPMMQHKKTESVLVIGGGDGGVLSELSRHPELEKLDICEIDAEVIAAAAEGRAEELLLPLDSLFAAYPALTIGAEEERRLRCGNDYPLSGTPDGLWRVYGETGAFLALSRAEAGQLTTIKSFFEV